MLLGKGLRKGTLERLRLAVGQDPSIIVHESKIEEAKGVPESYLEDLGLTKADLKRLERYGFAIRGYLRGTNWYGREVDGLRKRWVLIARG